MYPLLHLFGRTIGTYSLCALAGMLVGAFAVCRLAERRGRMWQELLLPYLSALAGMLVGARLLYGLVQLPGLSASGLRPEEPGLRGILALLRSLFGGMVFYGGLFGALAAVALHVRLAPSLAGAPAFDIFAVAAPLIHAFGRLGCFLGGCCYGIPCAFGFLVRENPLYPRMAGVVRLPVQLFEAAGCLALFALLLALYRRRALEGRLLRLYLFAYAIMRFALEFLRGDAVRGIWLGLSTSQWISLGILAWGLGMRIANKGTGNREQG